MGFIHRKGHARDLKDIDQLVEQCGRCTYKGAGLQCSSLHYTPNFRENMDKARDSDIIVGPHGAHTIQGFFKPARSDRPQCLIEVFHSKMPGWARDNIGRYVRNENDAQCLRIIEGFPVESQFLKDRNLVGFQGTAGEYDRDYDVSLPWDRLLTSLTTILGNDLVCA